MIRLGIIGCGRIVEVGHAKAWQSLADQVQVVAIADPTPERLEKIGEMLGVPKDARYRDYHDMLRNEKLDLVDIALPHFLHEEAAEAAAKAGVNIILEKPMATTLAEVDNMRDAIKNAGVQFSIIHNYKYQSLNATALKLVETGAIGKPFLIREEGLGGGHWPGTQSYDPNWRTRAATSGGGCLIDNAYHNIYLADTMMLSPVTRVYARIKTYLQPIDVDDTALVFLEHENGATSSIQVSWAVKAGGQRVHEVHGTKGSIRYDYRDTEGLVHPLALYDNERGQWSYPNPADIIGNRPSDFAAAFSDYLQALQAGKPAPNGLEAARRNLAIVSAAYESGKRGQPVDVSEFL